MTKFVPESETFRTYGENDGVRIGGSWDLAVGKAGNILVAGSEGWTSFRPEQLEDDTITPLVEITEFKIANEPILPGDTKLSGKSLRDVEELELKHNQNDVTIEYVGLHFTAPDLNRYNFMLDGFDETWRGETAERSATYTNLPFGEYTFQVKEANGDGVWNEEGASLAITILPPWWRTWWAYAIYGLLFVAGVITIDRIQRRRLIAKEREKTRERELAQAKEIEKAYTQLKATQQQLIQQEKMASLGQLTSGIAHEIKNPLNFVNNFADLIKDLLDDLRSNPKARIEDELDLIKTLRLNAEKINEHGRRADRIVQSMMQHAGGGRGEREIVDINAFVDEYVNLAFHGMRARYTELEVDIERQFDENAGPVEMVPQEIGQVLINLFNNAFDAMQEKQSRLDGQYRPRLSVSTHKTNGSIKIQISDNGPGIPDQVRDRVFEPFFTTKPTGSGTGLGLSLSYDIVTQGHGGRLEVQSEEGQGATFIVELPA